jgi:lysophospholipase L1-like esterase
MSDWSRRIILLVVTIILVEGGVRALMVLRDGTTVRDKAYDSELAWIPTPSYAPKTRQLRDFAGRSYERVYRTEAHGSRLWGSHPGSEKVLFIGDSYTQAVEVSNDKTYYAQFAKLSGLDTYEVGAGGYGTLQELMLTARTLRVTRVQPTVVVLQFCSNDWINNSAEIEGEWIFLDQRTRPYRTVDGRIIRTLGSSALLMNFLRYSRAASSLLFASEGMFAKVSGRFRFDRIGPARRATAEKEASLITAAELHELRALFPGARAYAFNCDEDQSGFTAFRQNDEFIRVAHEAGFVPLTGAMKYVESGPSGARGIRSADGGHLNNEGHRRLAEFLVRSVEGGSHH